MPSLAMPDLPPGTVIVVAATGLLFAAFLTSRVWLWLLGPVFAYEAARL